MKFMFLEESKDKFITAISIKMISLDELKLQKES
jgi:hypothetical protein